MPDSAPVIVIGRAEKLFRNVAMNAPLMMNGDKYAALMRACLAPNSM